MTEEQRTAPDPLVLVIDHCEVVRLFVVHAINALGYTATVAATAQEAIEVMAHSPSLRILVCDLSLGPINGPEFVRQALRNRPALRIIFIAVHSENVAVRKTDPLLFKPFPLQQLRVAIEAVLSEPERPFEPRRVGERRRSVLRLQSDASEYGIAS